MKYAEKRTATRVEIARNRLDLFSGSDGHDIGAFFKRQRRDFVGCWCSVG